MATPIGSASPPERPILNSSTRSPGGRLVLETPGGGGLGDPAERDASEVRDDVLNGYVSENAAREVYGDS